VHEHAIHLADGASIEIVNLYFHGLQNQIPFVPIASR
jgi:hypothetical protein